MEIDHHTLVALSKSWGLFYLIAFSIGVVIYTFWPSNRKRFDHAKVSIFDQDDRPRDDRQRNGKSSGPEA